MKTLIKRNIVFTKGTEGPKNDPYGFEEFSVFLHYEGFDPVEFRIHVGLSIWISIKQKNGDLHKLTFSSSSTKAWSLFEFFTGLSQETLHKMAAIDPRPKKCTECGSNKILSTSGFPGESFYVCESCKAIVACNLNAAVIIN